MKRAIALLVFAGAFFASTSLAHAGSCREVSDVVGEQQCSNYGDRWSIENTPPITFRFGFRYGEFSTRGAAFSEAFKSHQRPDGYQGYSFGGEALGVRKLSSYGFDGGIAYFIVGQLYAGLEGGIGFASIKSPTFTTGAHTLSNDSGINIGTFHAGAPIGYRIPLGRASIRGEMFLGGTIVSVSHNVSAPTIPDAPTNASSSAGRWLAEPRIAADVWFTQHISFGVYGGVNLLDTGGRVLGLSLTRHPRAFDGAMSFW